MGREIHKKFWVGKGTNRKQVLCKGKVTAIDEDADNPGHRLFEVRYEDGDVECTDAGEVAPYLGPFSQVIFFLFYNC